MGLLALQAIAGTAMRFGTKKSKDATDEWIKGVMALTQERYRLRVGIGRRVPTLLTNGSKG